LAASGLVLCDLVEAQAFLLSPNGLLQGRQSGEISFGSLRGKRLGRVLSKVRQSGVVPIAIQAAQTRKPVDQAVPLVLLLRVV